MKENRVSCAAILSSPEVMVAHIAELDDRELVARIASLAARERCATATLVAHLAEMDRRKLHLAMGYSSLFTYCIQALHLSEHGAYKRMEAARAARRFPVLFTRLAQGDLHLAAVVLLAPVLTKENHAALIEEARHKSKREVQEIVARIRPAAPVPSVVQKTPGRPDPAAESPMSPPPTPFPPNIASFAATPGTPSLAATPGTKSFAVAPGTSSLALAPDRPSAGPDAMSPAPQATCAPPPPPRPVVAPLGPGTYKVQFTAGTDMHERLMRARDLLRHQVPDGDIAAILDLALVALLEKTERRKLGRPNLGRRKHRHAVERRTRVRTGAHSEASATKQPEAKNGDANRYETNRPDVNKPDPNKPEAEGPEVNKHDAEQPDPNKPEAEGPEVNKHDAEQPDANKSEARKPETEQAEAPPDAPRPSGPSLEAVSAADGPVRPRSRHIPAEVRRMVWERDQGRCTFKSVEGVQCTETGFLEFDHREPYACGGPTTADNLRLLCRRHNQYRARLRFGKHAEHARNVRPAHRDHDRPDCSYSSHFSGLDVPLRL
jgi:hypothetical protein